MIFENGKKKKDIDMFEEEEVTELQEHKKDDKKISVGVVASICLFVVTLTVSIILITATIRNNKPAAQQTQFPEQQTQQTQTQQTQTQQPQDSDQQTTPVPSVRTVATSSAFPSGNLNNNTFPAYEFTEENYAKYYATIDHVELSAEVPDEAAQQVIEAFTCSMDILTWNNAGHILYVESREGDWWSVADTVYGFEMWINRDMNVVMYKDEGIHPDIQYPVLSAIYNFYGSSAHTVYCLGVVDGSMVAYISDMGEYFYIDPNSYEVLEVVDEGSVNNGQ